MKTMMMSKMSRNPKAKKNLAMGGAPAMDKQKMKGPAKKRHTLENRGQGTHWVPGPLKIPRRNAGGFYPLHSEGGY